MQRVKSIVSAVLLLCLAGVAVRAQAPAANNRQDVEQYIGQLLRRIDAGLSRYRASLDQSLAQNRLNGTNTERQANTLFQNFDETAGRLQKLFDEKQLASTDVYELVDRAGQLDNFMRSARLGQRADGDWAALRGDVTELARNYGIRADWNQTSPAPAAGRPAPRPVPVSDDDPQFGATSLLTGTYRIDATRSDDAAFVSQRAARSVPVRERARLSQDLKEQLEAPTELILDQRGTAVIIATDRSAQTTFEADGQYRSERAPNGGTLRTRATLRDDVLEIRTTGDRNNGSLVTIESIDGGRALRVSRQITDSRVPQPVLVVSVYNKISSVARLDDNGSVNASNARDDDAGLASDDFLIGDGVQIVATLDQDLSTKTARDNDRFTMTIRSPRQFEGAVIEGYITGLARSGRATGRARMVLNFERLRLLDGATYRFAGIIETVTSSTGEKVKIDDEGGLSENENRTATTAKRTGGGAAAGAVIGGILGGGKGAAIGGIIGAGSGAGSVYAEGRDDLQVLRGSEITVRASAPRTRTR